MQLRKKPKPAYKKKHAGLHNLGLFMVVFSVLGGVMLLYKTQAAVSFVAYPPHRAQCVANSPSKTFVRPGETFPVTVQMKNTGTSTWSPDYGFFLSEYSSGATSGVTIWKNVKGATFTGSTGPGGTRTFNLTVTAPTTPGTYGMSWGMHIVFAGFLHDPCTNKNITVKNPPAVSLNLNGQASNISVTKGAGLTLSWSASNGATSCTASGNWSGAKSPPSGGSENRSGDTASTGTRTYTLVCSNEVGAGTAITRTVSVTAPPTSPPPSGGGSGGTSSGGSGSRASGGSSGSVPALTVDTTPPSAPTNFQANYDENEVILRWDAASGDQGVSGYELEKSTDQVNWQRIGDTVTGESYTDQEVSFDMTYYYRLRALDQAGNASSHATTEVKTGSFDPNAKADEALVLTSDDGVAKVTIPAGALSEEASCTLKPSRYLTPSLKDYVSFSGPYELVCKVASGNKISSFAQPVSVEVILNEDMKKEYSEFKYFTRSDDWEEVSEPSSDNSFVLGESTDFALMGKTKKTPLWQKILLVLFVIGTIAGLAIVVLTRVSRWRLKRKLEEQNRANYYKEHGY